MSGSQRRAVDNYRLRLAERGLARFEVIGRDSDRELLRSIAKRLAEEGAEADRLRAAVQPGGLGATSTKGEIYRALRNSPLVGANSILAALGRWDAKSTSDDPVLARYEYRQ